MACLPGRPPWVIACCCSNFHLKLNYRGVLFLIYNLSIYNSKYSVNRTMNNITLFFIHIKQNKLSYSFSQYNAHFLRVCHPPPLPFFRFFFICMTVLGSRKCFLWKGTKRFFPVSFFLQDPFSRMILDLSVCVIMRNIFYVPPDSGDAGRHFKARQL